jgi:hypothetical protein
MPRIADSKTDIEYSGPYAQELKSFAAPGSWTKEKSDTFSALVQGLTKTGYRNFSSSVEIIGLQRNGQSAIYHVPIGQRGVLSAYAGKYVHIVCVAYTDKYTGRLFSLAQVSEGGQLAQKRGKGRPMKRTTDPGYVNTNGQRVIRKTSKRGDDRNQWVYVMRCSKCANEYGVNGSDIWQRKCPKCGGGAPGLDY